MSRPNRAYAKADVIDLAAICTARIVKHHPFLDGNKLTGFVVGHGEFLRANVKRHPCGP